MNRKPLLVCVVGATATGKTDVAVEIAGKLNTEIISFDSVQVYRDFNIGSAKPPASVLSKVKHHLIDEVDPSFEFSAGDFRKRALEIVASLKHKFEVFVLVGGTGFYLQALLKGMFDVPYVDPKLKQMIEEELKSKGINVLYAELVSRDPAYAKRIHENDTYRIMRAIELMRSGEKTVTEIQTGFAAQESPFEIMHVGLRREKEMLLKSVQSRTEKMLRDGLVEETRALIQKYAPAATQTAPRALDSVGYREATTYLGRRTTESDLAIEITKSTMALAKRQNTWFKREKSTHWFDSDHQSAEAVAKEAATLIGARETLRK